MSRSRSASTPYRFNRAIVRNPGRSVVDGLRADNRRIPTYNGVKAEHDAYLLALEAAGITVIALPALEDFPDSTFVEDPALVFGEGAILLRPGAPTRVGEVHEIATTLREMFENVIEMPTGLADGGDVLVTPERVLIGLSDRTDCAGAEALTACLAELGREAKVVETPDDVLHFKSACSLLDEETIFCVPQLVDSGVFKRFRQILTPDGEEAAANALRVNDQVLVGAGFPRSIELLCSLGYNVVPVPVSEIGKIDAGLSCMSLRWRASG